MIRRFDRERPQVLRKIPVWVLQAAELNEQRMPDSAEECLELHRLRFRIFAILSPFALGQSSKDLIDIECRSAWAAISKHPVGSSSLSVPTSLCHSHKII